jgi:GTP-binding protein LepA
MNLENFKNTPLELIRNFSIIAHIDHGKSTIADCILRYCGAVEERKMKAQFLDNLKSEQERGITIKAQSVHLLYKADDGKTYNLNLIDTPGHVDFAYEVNRSLAACEGSILVVDSSQGVEAQTLANAYKAIDNNHEFVIALNKIDLPASDIEGAKKQIEDIIGLDTSDAVLVSAKNQIGIKELLENIVKTVPAPKGEINQPLCSMLMDSWYDPYLGVIILVRIVNGVMKKGQQIRMMQTGGIYKIDNIGVFAPEKLMVDELHPGEIGFITGSIKQVGDCRVGDTITDEKNPAKVPLPGFKPAQSVVFSSLFPADSSQFEYFRESIAKLHLNDASFQFELENSGALGYGFRCGFLGLLHLEIIQERLEDEYDIDLIATAPSVVYRIYLDKPEKDQEFLEIHNASDMPESMRIKKSEEPWVKANIIAPHEYIGPITELCMEKRGMQTSMQFMNERVILTFELPLAEIIFDFYDRLKSISRGYASLDWEVLEYRDAPVVRLNILVNGEELDALSLIVHKTKAESRGREICAKLKELIPRQLYAVAIQAAIGGKIIARESISAYRKDVTAKCYGGDITRKKKLLEKQKRGKKRMKQIGNIEVPHSAFIEALKIKD